MLQAVASAPGVQELGARIWPRRYPSFGIRVARRAAPVGSAITATATDSFGNTSEFSAALAVE